MKKIVNLIILLFTVTTFAQAPDKMSYQSVIRNNQGVLLTDKNITIQISILKGSENGEDIYIETHKTYTNKNGLVTLEIGDGEIIRGKFADIDWSNGSYFIKTATDANGGTNFDIVGVSELLSVPYALHAKTVQNAFSGDFNDLINKPTKLSDFTNDIDLNLPSKALLKSGGPTSNGVPSQTWSLFGNSDSLSSRDKLGTTNFQDLVIVTNNLERLRITAEGEIITGKGKFTIGGNLEVQGDQTTINKDLYVGRNVYLNSNDDFDPHGETINYGNFTVANNSKTNLTGNLDVGQTLNIDGATTLQSSLDVNNAAPTHLTGALVVDGAFELNNTFSVTTNAEDGNYVAEFENLNAGDGDGIKIKLGKKATKNGGGFDVIDQGLSVFVLQGFGPDKFSSIKALFDGNIDTADGQFLAEMLVPDPADALAIASSICTLTESVTNLIFSDLNSRLNLPLVFEAVVLPALCVDADFLGNICVPGFKSDTEIIPKFTIIPKLPTKAQNNLSFGCDALGSGFQFPQFSFADQSNVLTGENTFIEFSDNTDWTMGAIKAQTIDEWGAQYLDPVFLYELYSTFKGIDKSQIFPEIRRITKEAAESYLQIGVEYSSGNGDYAEWLERVDTTESISAGDIVGVKGGKITKDLANAEQVMAISHRPIVLGNIPKAGENFKGNNVAFMGQIPVKIMGAVASGDYIVGKNNIPGYGVAIHPENMTVEDFKFAVGRSWDTNSDNGPKMTNTVVGVHNGDFIHILKKLETKYQESEARMSSIEAKVNLLTSSLSQARN